VSADIVADTACPECGVGKHQNCDGESWDKKTDGPAVCPCCHSGHTVVRLDDHTTSEIRALPHPHKKPQTWRVEARTHGQHAWQMYVDRLDREVALQTAEVIQPLHPTWELRVVDEATAEAVHLGRDGKPLQIAPRPWTPDEDLPSGGKRITVKRVCDGCGKPIGDVTEAELDRTVAGLPLLSVRGECPNCMPARIDTRTEEEVQADRLADRYEASLERGRDL